MHLLNYCSLFIIFSLLADLFFCKSYDKFTSAEISIPFKTISARDNVVFKTNILGEIKNCSIDITSSKHLLYLSKEVIKNQDLNQKKYTTLINQDREKIKGYKKRVNIVYPGDKYRKSILFGNIKSIIVESNNKNKLHSLGFSHIIREENSLVHFLYNSHLISQRQFSILYSYPDWGTLSFGKEGTLITDMKNLQRECKAVNSIFWGCHLSGIYIENTDLPLEDEKIKKNNINIEINQDTIFDNGEPEVIVPEEVFAFFYNYYFDKSLFIEEKCRIYENHFYKRIICKGLENNKNKNDFESMKRIHFVFDDFVDIYLLGKYFFDKDKNFKIIFVKGNNNFIFGKIFLSHYYTIYSYDENKITFFGMFGGRYLQSKINYKKKMELKDYTINQYTRYKIPIVNRHIFPLLKILLFMIAVGNIVSFITLSKVNKAKEHKELLL